jgi:hypothetical protein
MQFTQVQLTVRPNALALKKNKKRGPEITETRNILELQREKHGYGILVNGTECRIRRGDHEN